MTMIPTSPVPDALFIRESLKRGATLYERMNSILDIAEPILAVDRAKGERAYIRRQGDGWLFVTRDSRDSIGFALNTPLRGRPRYDWVLGADGIKRGYLKPEARDLVAPPFDPISAGCVPPGGF
jgi:hypothetical protein